MSAKLLGFFDTFMVALSNPLPSFHPLDLVVGIICGTGLRLAVYLKGKNAKKYRHNEEYGSARWGTAKDIEPFMDQKFEDNIILTKTERQIYVEYRKSGYSKKFFEEHRQEITIHKAAKQAFDEAQITKLPSMQSLYEEFHRLTVQKKQDYAEYRKIRKEKEELLIAKQTVETILNIDKKKEQEQEKKSVR